MKQDNLVRIISEDKKIMLLCEPDTAIGVLHDFLLMVKGVIVDRINKAQVEEEKVTEAVKAKDKEKIKKFDDIEVKVTEAIKAKDAEKISKIEELKTE